MDIETFAMCRSNLGWYVQVPSKDGNRNYEVAFEQLPPGSKTIYGFTCTCPGFKFGKGAECKHIKEVKHKFCGWHEQHDGGSAVNGKCPNCGGEVVGVRCAV